MKVKVFSCEFIEKLIDDAIHSPRGRMHRNVHSSFKDPCQRFFNSIGIDSYIQPHRHLLDPKPESLIAVQGLFALITFNESGKINDIVHFGTEKYKGINNIGIGVELSAGIWHTVISLKDSSVLLEVKAGPFDMAVAKEPAGWAPAEGSSNAAEYLISLRNIACSKLHLKGNSNEKNHFHLSYNLSQLCLW